MKRSTLVLLAAAGALLLFIFLVERKQRSTKELEESGGRIFASFPEEVVSIKREGFGDVLLEKVKDEWLVKNPVEDPADKSGVEGFLMTLEDADASRLIKGKIDPEKLGLSKPEIRIVLKSADGETVLETGARPPLEKGVYFRTGERVGVLDDITLDTIKKSVNDFRSKELCVPLKPEDVRSLTYKKGGVDVFSLENPKGQWMVKKPFDDLADGRKAYLLVEDVLLWPIMAFEEDTAAGTGLASPSETFEIGTFDNRKITISLGALKEEKKRFYYASVSTRKGVFVVSKNSLRNLDAGMEQMRSLAVFPADMNSFATMTIEKGSLLILRNDPKKGWVSGDGKIKEEQVKTFIYAAADLSGDKSVVPRDKGIIYATVDLKTKDETESVDFYETKDGLLADIRGRKIFVTFSKEDGERMKSAIDALFTQGK